MRRELVEDPFLLRLGRQLRLSPGVGELDRDEGLNEQCLAAAGLVVDDALDAAPRIRPHRHHVAAVAQRDDGFLQGTRDIRVDQGIEPAAQPVVGDADGTAQAAEGGRGRIEHLAGGVHAGFQARAQGRQWVDVAVQRVQQRPVESRASHPPGGRPR